MNKKEREALCEQIAKWDWQHGGSSSEASARGRCAQDMIELFGLADHDDLAFSRAYEIFKLTSTTEDDDEYFDILCDNVGNDYKNVIDKIETEGLDKLRDSLESLRY